MSYMNTNDDWGGGGGRGNNSLPNLNTNSTYFMKEMINVDFIL